MSAAHDEHYSPEWQSIGISDVQQTDSSVFKNLEFGLPTKWIPFGVRKNEQRGEGCFRQAQAAVSAVDALKSQGQNRLEGVRIAAVALRRPIPGPGRRHKHHDCIGRARTPRSA